MDERIGGLTVHRKIRAQLKERRGLDVVGVERRHARIEPMLVHHAVARRTFRHPVAHGVHIFAVERDLASLAIALLSVDRVVGSDHAAGLIDPEGGRNVAHVVELRHGQLLVEKAWMHLVGGFDERLDRRPTLGVAGDRDDLEIAVLQLLPQLLPDRQVKSAASPGRPEEKQDLPAQQLG